MPSQRALLPSRPQSPIPLETPASHPSVQPESRRPFPRPSRPPSTTRKRSDAEQRQLDQALARTAANKARDDALVARTTPIAPLPSREDGHGPGCSSGDQRAPTDRQSLRRSLSSGSPRPGTCVDPGHPASDAHSSSLDPDESSQQNDLDPDVTFRHSWWAHDRIRLAAAFRTVFGSCPRTVRFATCGEAAWVYRTAERPYRYKVVADYCRDRWCRACQRDRSRKIAGNLRTRLDGLEVRLITLTIRSRTQTLRDLVDRLYESFRTLRRQRFWRDAVTGGVAFLEIKYNAGTNRWHPHLHIIATGDYLSQRRLATLWRRITGDSHIVDVRLVRDPDRVVNYVVGYATKTMDHVIYRHPSRLREAIISMQGRRTATTFGCFRGWRLTKDCDPADWVSMGSLVQIRAAAGRGDAAAAVVLLTLTEHSGSPASGRRPP